MAKPGRHAAGRHADRRRGRVLHRADAPRRHKSYPVVDEQRQRCRHGVARRRAALDDREAGRRASACATSWRSRISRSATRTSSSAGSPTAWPSTDAEPRADPAPQRRQRWSGSSRGATCCACALASAGGTSTSARRCWDSAWPNPERTERRAYCARRNIAGNLRPDRSEGFRRRRSSMLTLYYSPDACSMASHIVLEESGEKYEPQRMDLAKGEQRTRGLSEDQPAGPRAGCCSSTTASRSPRTPRSCPISASASSCGRPMRWPRPRRCR